MQLPQLIFLPVINFFAPDFMQAELEGHRKEFVAKSGLIEEQYDDAVQAALANITQMPAASYLPFKKEAIEASPDHDDWPFFAVALCLNCPLWSNEKRLARQEKVKIISTAGLLKRLGWSENSNPKPAGGWLFTPSASNAIRVY
jgi:predicted nucleic acid-binding protein